MSSLGNKATPFFNAVGPVYAADKPTDTPAIVGTNMAAISASSYQTYH